MLKVVKEKYNFIILHYKLNKLLLELLHVRETQNVFDSEELIVEFLKICTNVIWLHHSFEKYVKLATSLI